MRKGTAQMYLLGLERGLSRTRRTSCSCSTARRQGEVQRRERRPTTPIRSSTACSSACTSMENGPERQALVDQMVEILRRDAPWVWGCHPKDYSLAHQWVYNRKPNKMANNGLEVSARRSGAARKIAERNGTGRWCGRCWLALVRAGASRSCPRCGLPAARARWRRSARVQAARLISCLPGPPRALRDPDPDRREPHSPSRCSSSSTTPDDMARMQLGQKRVTPEAIAEMEGRSAATTSRCCFNAQARRASASSPTPFFFEKSVQHVLVRFRARRRRARHRARDPHAHGAEPRARAARFSASGSGVYLTFALADSRSSARPTSTSWGVVLCVAAMSISGCSTSSAGSG